MPFTPTSEKLLPDLTPREELVLLARTLWREGYDDHLAGHITVNLGDGTLLGNPWLLTWDESRPRDGRCRARAAGRARRVRPRRIRARGAPARGRARAALQARVACARRGRDEGVAPARVVRRARARLGR